MENGEKSFEKSVVRVGKEGRFLKLLMTGISKLSAESFHFGSGFSLVVLCGAEDCLWYSVFSISLLWLFTSKFLDLTSNFSSLRSFAVN